MNATQGGRLAVPHHLLATDEPAEHYVLRVVGDAMQAEGVCDGDFLVILRTRGPLNGDMAVLSIGDENLLRWFYRTAEGVIRLEPGSVLVPDAEVQILGVAVGLMRKWARGKEEPHHG